MNSQHDNKFVARIYEEFEDKLWHYGDLGELEEEMRRAFHGQFEKDINVKSEIGVMLPSSFDGIDSDELTVEQIVHGPPEYSQWENRN